jgi:glutamate racemase
LGGLTVVNALRRRLPGESIVYVGDTARVPYGSKSPEAIRRASTEVLEAALDRLTRQGRRPKHLVVACNSASAVALYDLRLKADGIDVTGVIQSGVRAACAAGGKRARPTIGVIATQATVDCRAYDSAISARRPKAQLLLRSTPLLVPLVEEGRRDNDPIVDLALRQYLTPMIRRANDVGDGLHALVLGCTHYPILMQPIRRIVGDETVIVDSASSVAEDVAAVLKKRALRAEGEERGDLQIFATDVPSRFGKLAGRFLGEPVEGPELLDLDAAPAPQTPRRKMRIG